ncbi:MAG: rhomboid family intramembrane serine protease [Actinomycetes bacterium]
MSTDPPMVQAPRCPAHPSRQTRISCTRCGRPICYECMVPAPVGFQCRECVHQAAETAPIYTPTAVSSARALDPSRRPYVTYGIVAICVAVYLVGFLVPALSHGKYGMVPALIALDDQWYRLITAAFLHAGIIHIAFNMVVLIMLGPTLEKVLGHFRYAVLYLLAALGGSICSYAFSDPLSPSVGASGAIFGLMGALIVAGRRLKFDVTQVVVLLVINLLIGFIPGGNVDWRAHLGGLITGALVALVLSHPVKRNAVLVQVVGCLAIVVALVLVGGVRTTQLRNDFMPTDPTPISASAGPWGTIDVGSNTPAHHSPAHST